MPLTQMLILTGSAYLLGSVPFGLLVGKAKGIDVRTAGSGNIGATNVGRLLGRRFFWIVFLLDVLKGLLPTLAASMLVAGIPMHDRTWPIYLLWLLVGVGGILGHLFSVFLRFKGGKGVATSTGVGLGLFPYLTLPVVVAGIVFIIVYSATRYISLGSLTGAVTVPLAYVALALWQDWPLLGQQLPLFVLTLLLTAMIFYTHRSNISRLLNGTENRTSPRARSVA
jgi:acyl phosphate:glycerol-3-phosphate acyltransferase